MVPIYAVLAFCALFWREHELYFDLIRESYEAFVIYSFLQFLVKYMGGDAAMVEILKEKAELQKLAKKILPSTSDFERIWKTKKPTPSKM